MKFPFNLLKPETFEQRVKARRLNASIAFGLFCGANAVVLQVAFWFLVQWYPEQRTLSTSVLAGSGAFAWLGCLSVLLALAGNRNKIAASRDGISLETAPDDGAPLQPNCAPSPVPPSAPQSPSAGAEGPHIV